GVGCGRWNRLSVVRLAGGRTGVAPQRSARLDRLGVIPLALRPSSSRALRHAGGTSRSLRVVVSNGHRPWRRPDGVAGAHAAVAPERFSRGEWLAGGGAHWRWRACVSDALSHGGGRGHGI